MKRIFLYIMTQPQLSYNPQHSQPSAQPGLGAGLTTEVTEEVVLFIVTTAGVSYGVKLWSDEGYAAHLWFVSREKFLRR